MTSDYNANTSSGYSGGGQTQEDVTKIDLVRTLIQKNTTLSDKELAVLTGFNLVRIQKIRAQALASERNDNEAPLSWDYVLAFDVGEEDNTVDPAKSDKKRVPEDARDSAEWEDGMPQRKWFGQIYLDIAKRLQNARLTVNTYKSNDEQTMFLLIGITETFLKDWADERDTDLRCSPRGAVEYGRDRHFPLAMRTTLSGEGDEEAKQREEDAGGGGGGGGSTRTIAEQLWEFLFLEYNRYVPQSIYKQYDRIPGQSDYRTPFEEKTRLRIIYEAIISDDNEGGGEVSIEELLHSKRHPLKAAFPLHSVAMLEEFDRTWIREFNPCKLLWCPMDEIQGYFGEPVAFYFAFLSFYLRWLLAPSVIGFAFFILQMVTSIDAPGIYLMCFFIIFWSVAFVDFWYRQESYFRLVWGMTKFEQKAVARPQFHGEWSHDPISGRWAEQFAFWNRGLRMTSILTGILLFLGACIAGVMGILTVRDSDPNNQLLKIELGVANGAMIFVFDMLYKFFSKYGNEWENHRTEQDFQNALIQKSFFFKFFNSFSSLFYLGFVRPANYGNIFYIKNYFAVCEAGDGYIEFFVDNYDSTADSGFWDKCAVNACRKQDNLCPTDCYDLPQQGYPSSLAVGSDCGGVDSSAKVNAVGGCPVVCDPLDVTTQINGVILNELQLQLASLFVTAIVIQNTLEVLLPFVFQKIKSRKREKEAAEKGDELVQLSEPELQMEMDAYENTIDDMSEMIVQFGYVTLFVMALPITPLLALINNVIEMKVDAINLCKTSQRPHPNGSFGLGAWNSVLSFFSYVSVGTNVALITWRTRLVSELFADNSEYKWIFFSVLGLTLGLLVAAEKAIIPDVPYQVTDAIERQRLVESVLVLGANVEPYKEAPPSGQDNPNEWSFDPSAKWQQAAQLPTLPADNLQYGGVVDDQVNVFSENN